MIPLYLTTDAIDEQIDANGRNHARRPCPAPLEFLDCQHGGDAQYTINYGPDSRAFMVRLRQDFGSRGNKDDACGEMLDRRWQRLTMPPRQRSDRPDENRHHGTKGHEYIRRSRNWRDRRQCLFHDDHYPVADTRAGRQLTVTNHVDNSRHMKPDLAIEALSALAQTTRLSAFRLLVRQEPEGLPAGEIARRLDVPHNTMSNHLATLTRAGLVSVKRQSRTMIYRVELKTVRKLVMFLLKDCCNGQPELCAPLIAEISKSRSNSGACCG